MNTVEEQLTDALRRRDAELVVRDELDLVLDAARTVRASSSRSTASPQRLPLLRVAAVTVVLIGGVGLVWAANSSTAPPSVSIPTISKSAVPAGFPRLQLPDSRSAAGRRLVGAQDYAIESGWFSFQNYDEEVDLNHDGAPTRRGTFSITVFTGTQVDADRAGCALASEVVVQGGRTISIYERTQGQRRFIWNEAPGVFVVVETNFITRADGLAAVASLEPTAEDAWQRRLGELSSVDVVTDPDGPDAIWWYYTTARPIVPPTTVPGESVPAPAVSALC